LVVLAKLEIVGAMEKLDLYL
jgi:hypothetical protein